MEFIDNFRLLKTKVKQLEIKNDGASNTFQSFQLVFYELQSENERLKAEEIERKLRMDVMTSAQERIYEICELNQNLVKFVLEQKARLTHSKTTRQFQSPSSDSNSNFQKTIQQKLKDMEESHSNITIVKRHAELHQMIVKLNQEIEQLNKAFKDDERNFETKQQNLNEKMFKLIIKLATRAMNKVEEAAFEEEKTPETPQLIQSASLIDKITKPPPMVIRKLDDFKIPDLPLDIQMFKQPNKVNVETILSDLKQQMKKSLISNADGRKRPFTSILFQTQSKKISSSTKQCKETNKLPVENKMGAYPMLPKIPRIEQLQKQDKTRKKEQLASDKKCAKYSKCDGPHTQISVEESSKANLTVKQHELVEEQDTKQLAANVSFISHTKPKQISPDQTPKLDLNEKQTVTQMNGSKNVVVLSNILIKEAPDESKRKESNVKPKQNVETNINPIKTQNQPFIDTSMIKPANKETSAANMKKDVEKEVKTSALTCGNNIPPSAIIRQPTAVQKTYTRKEQNISGTDQIIEAKSNPTNNPKSVTVQSFKGEIVDLNSELPSSHVTIDSSSQNSEVLQESGKLSFTESSSDSACFFKDFLTDFNVGPTQSQTADLKRKGSDDVPPLAGGFDFENFDFSKRPKIDSGEISDDFFGKLDGLPLGEDGGGKGDTMFNFDDFMSFA